GRRVSGYTAGDTFSQHSVPSCGLHRQEDYGGKGRGRGAGIGKRNGGTSARGDVEGRVRLRGKPRRGAIEGTAQVDKQADKKRIRSRAAQRNHLSEGG